MSVIHSQKQTAVQKTDTTFAFSILDSSSQNEALQRKADMTSNAAQHAAPPRPNNTGMPDNLKSGIESLSGFSMDDVRVHYNSSKPATVQALAYTQGTDIHVAPGQEKHLPHEAWHVAQQKAGRVSPITNINGMPVNDNASLEHEADVMGEKAVQCKSGNAKSKATPCSAKPIQCYKKIDEYVVSKTGKYAVKENEASTVYVNNRITTDMGIQHLNRLGILPNTALLNIEGEVYDVYKQIRTPETLSELLSSTAADAKSDKIPALETQKGIVQDLINVCNKWSEAKKDEKCVIAEEEKIKISGHEKTIEFFALGSDILYDFKVVEKWINSPENIDSNLLKIVLDDLILRHSQIENEIEARQRQSLETTKPFWKTECGALANQIKRQNPQISKLGLDITSPDDEFENSSIASSLWRNHFSAKIADDESDVLCIEDAAGKSSIGTKYLADAHWIARIYGAEDRAPEKEGTFKLDIVKPLNMNIPHDLAWTFKAEPELDADLILKVTFSVKEGSFNGIFNKETVPYAQNFLLQTACSYLKKFIIRKYSEKKKSFCILQ